MTIASRATLLASLSTLALAAPAGAQTNPQAQQTAAAQAQAQVDAQGQPTTNEQTIVITGTRRTDRTVPGETVHR